MAKLSVVQKRPSGRGDGLSDSQKVGELELLLLQIEAVATSLEQCVEDGKPGDPPNEAHGLQLALMTLTNHGLEITGAR